MPNGAIWTVFCLWALFSLPPLLSLVGTDGSTGRLLFMAFVSLLGHKLWGAICPVQHWLIKYWLGFIGLAAFVSAVLSAFLPVGALTIVAVIGAPFAAVHLWKEL